MARQEAIELMLTMRPRLRRIIPRTAARQRRKTLMKFSSMTSRRSSSSSRMKGTDSLTAALLTSTSTPPQASSTAATVRAAAAGSLRLAWIGRHSAPAALTSTRWPLSSPCPPSSWAASSRDALREGSSAPFDMIVYWINIYHANAASQPFERSEQGVASGLQAADQTQRRPLISPSLSDLEGGAAGSDLQ